MPILRNPRHERFAQALAEGKSETDAYVAAGYSENANGARASASRLLANAQNGPLIRARVDELLAEREKIHAQATAEAIKATGLTKEWVIETLQENVRRAMQAEAVRSAEGETIGEYAYQGSVANRALELLGKELGMFIERREVKQETTVTDERKSARERVADILGEEAATAHGGDAAGRDPPAGDETLH